MKNIMLVIGVILVISLVMLVSGESYQTVKTVEIPLKYEQYPLADTLYYRNVTVDFPDGIGEILSIELTLKGDFLASTMVQGGVLAYDQVIFCDPSSWTTPTWNSDNYEVTFDCTSFVGNWKGDNEPIQFLWMANQISGNVKPKVKVTYYNNPLSSISISGTDYQPNDNATVFLQLIADNQPLNRQACTFCLWNTTKQLIYNFTPMTYLENSDGLYYFDFPVPNEVGVHMVTARCTQPVNATTELAESFDIVEGNEYAGNFQRTHILDGSYHKLRETSSSPRTFLAFYNFSADEINTSAIFKVVSTIKYNLHPSGSGGTPDTEDFYMQYWNWTAGYCDSNITILTGHDVDTPEIVTTTLSDENGIYSDYVSPEGNFTVCFTDDDKSDTQRSQLEIDYLVVQLVSFSDASASDIRGSGEVNVRSIASTLNITGNVTAQVNATEIWEYPNRTLTDYNQTELFNLLNEINATLNGTLINITGNITIQNEDLYRRLRNLYIAFDEQTFQSPNQPILAGVGTGFIGAIGGSQVTIDIANSTCIDQNTLRQFYDANLLINDSYTPTSIDSIGLIKYNDFNCPAGCETYFEPQTNQTLARCGFTEFQTNTIFLWFIVILLVLIGILWGLRNRRVL